MSVALWCVLVAALLPWILTSIAKSGGGYDNADPRGYLRGLTGLHQRANSAQQNGFEAFPLFAAAVILVEMKGVPHGTVDLLAIGFIVARVAHAAAYLGNAPRLRSLAWFVGLGLTLAIFVSPLWA